MRDMAKGGKVMKNKPLVSSSQKSFLRAKLLILSEACPLDQSNPSTCPFHEIKNWRLKERMAWFDKLSEDAILNINTYCRLCREAKTKLG
jgi:hypothetical protein